MAHFVGLDVSVQETAVCVVDAAGKVVCEQKIATEPDDLVGLLTSIGGDYGRIGIEAGPQWLVNGLAEAGLPVICVETRHMNSLLEAQQVNKSDRHDPASHVGRRLRLPLGSRPGSHRSGGLTSTGTIAATGSATGGRGPHGDGGETRS